MPSDAHAPALGRRSWIPVAGLLMALAGLLLTDWGAVDRGVVRDAVARDLDRIAELAGLRADGSSSMPVTVVLQGGPTWVTEHAELAVELDPRFERGEPNLLQLEVVEFGRTYGVRGQLWRQGWSLRAPGPLWISSAPWIVLMSVLAGAGVAGLRRRVGEGWVVAGLLAQLLAWALPWPPSLLRPPLSQGWREGPLGHAVVELARALPDVSVAVGAGIITLCVLLMIFDHRRTSDRGAGLVAGGLLGLLGLLAWAEAASRVGLGPWARSPAGALALGGAAALWAWAWLRCRAGAEALP